MLPFGLLHLGLLAATAGLLVARHFSKPKALRSLLTVLPILVMAWGCLSFAATYFPRPLAFARPYEPLGQWNTTDVGGAPCVVDLYLKNLGVSNPPGTSPRLKVVGNSADGRATKTYDTDWRFWSGTVRPIPGGIAVFRGSNTVPRIQFLLKDGTWSVMERAPESE
jgi:hypothetical protein